MNFSIYPIFQSCKADGLLEVWDIQTSNLVSKINLSQLLKYFRKGECTDQISELTNKSAATSGKRKSLTSDQETEFIFLFDPSEGRFNSGIQVLRSYLSYIYCKFLLKIKCCQISFSKQRNLHTDLGSLLWFLQQFKTFLCEENVNLY